jgi:phosphate transport system permease protein
MVWLCGAALALNLLLTSGILLLLASSGLGYFWQRELVHLALKDGRKLLGEVHNREPIPEGLGATRIRLKVGNRDVTGLDFIWINESEVEERSSPEDAVVLERLEYGNFYGTMSELRRGGEVLAAGSDAVWAAFQPLHKEKLRAIEEISRLEKRDIGDINHEIEALRLEGKGLALKGLGEKERRELEAAAQARLAAREAEYQKLADSLFALREELLAEVLVMRAADGREKEIPVSHVVRAVRPNRMTTAQTVGLYLERVREFVCDDPRESNTEGGIFPAIFGTVMMVFIMSLAVVPFGVLAALYLREYAREGPLVRLVRTAVNNLAGVPSIVFGVFGLGFFVYLCGGTIDRLFYPEALPTPTYGTGGILWGSLTLALLTVPVVIVATEEGLAAVPRIVREGSLALGATKFETTWRVVLPAAGPAVLTGMILAMARAAGEVAPLMIVGMVKLAPTLPIDHHFPFVHLERKFMHLGFHIYDVGFQSPNVEAAKPLVFATAFLLVLIVTLMNVVAFTARNHLRRKYATSAV